MQATPSARDTAAGAITVSTQQLQILRHSLGLRSDGSGRQYRNHFVTGPGSDDFDACESLKAAGLMRKYIGSVLTGGSPCYTVTPAGEAIATGSAA